MERDRVESSNSRFGKKKITSIVLGIDHWIFPVEICLPNYVLLHPILKITWFLQGSPEVKLKRELLEEHANRNMDEERFSST